MSDDDTSGVLEPYREKTKLRSFKIQVKDGHIFYVNHYLLAEQTPVFENMFFGDFKEANNQEAHFPNETVDSLNLLFSTLGMGYPVPREITDDVLIELLRMAHVYDMAFLRKRCVEYIRNRVSPKDTMKNDVLIWMCTLLQFLIDDGHADYKDVKLDIADTLASVTIAQLTDILIWDKIKDLHFLKEILNTSAENTSLLKNQKHTLAFAWISDPYSYCCQCRDSDKQALLSCAKCSNAYCSSHFSDNCPKKPDMWKINRYSFFRTV